MHSYPEALRVKFSQRNTDPGMKMIDVLSNVKYFEIMKIAARLAE